MEELLEKATRAGWSQPELGVAFDLIDNLVGKFNPEINAQLSLLQEEIESIDYDLERLG